MTSNVFVINKETKEHIATIDFVPSREERIILKAYEKDYIEYKVSCVVYHPAEHGILVFVIPTKSYYNKMISEIKWTKQENDEETRRIFAEHGMYVPKCY